MTIFKRLFRVFAIIYCSHFDNIEQLGAAAHLNTSFKVRGDGRRGLHLAFPRATFLWPPPIPLPKLVSDDCSRMPVGTLKPVSMLGYSPRKSNLFFYPFLVCVFEQMVYLFRSFESTAACPLVVWRNGLGTELYGSNAKFHSLYCF